MSTVSVIAVHAQEGTSPVNGCVPGRCRWKGRGKPWPPSVGPSAVRVSVRPRLARCASGSVQFPPPPASPPAPGRSKSASKAAECSAFVLQRDV